MRTEWMITMWHEHGQLVDCLMEDQLVMLFVSLC